MTATHLTIHGLVQGVFYRASTRNKAREHGVTGWTRNLPDGRVEVLACGDAVAVNALCDWLWEGPSQAKVDDVICEPRDYQEFHDFGTG